MFSEILKKIMSTGITEIEAKKLVDDKKTELSDLVSDEGAAYIVAKELGISIDNQKHLKISNIMSGMQSVQAIGKIIFISPIREFSTPRAKGKVANITIADETGSIHLSLWNEEIEKLNALQKGDVVKIFGYVKEDNQGAAELRLGREGSIEKADIEIDTGEEKPSLARNIISELSVGDYVEIRASLLQLFESPPFFTVCPECGKSVKEPDYNCEDHGKIEPIQKLRISGILDDGTSSIRAVFFADQAEKILGFSTEEARKIFSSHGVSGIIKLAPLGEEFIVAGRIQQNKLSGRNEIMARNVKNINVLQEIRSYLNK